MASELVPRSILGGVPRTVDTAPHFDLREEGVGGRDPDVSCKQQLESRQ
jgi:hypothetical protein